VFSTRNYQFKVQQQKKSTKSLIKVQCKLRVENTLFSRYASKVSNVFDNGTGASAAAPTALQASSPSATIQGEKLPLHAG
jgi:hypothetical protein